MSEEFQLEGELRRAVALHNQGDVRAAEKIYRRVLKRDPAQADALHFLGVIHRDRGELDRAIASFEAALASQPNRGDAHYDLGLAYRARAQFAQAERHLRRATEIDPTAAAAFNELGLVLRQLGRGDDAVASFQAAINRNAAFFEAYINLCNLLRYRGDMTGVRAVAEQGLAVLPDSGDLHVHRAEALFASGKLAEGWVEYAWRYRTKYQAMPDRQPDRPPWRGEALTAKKLLVWSEQGIGDVVMYASQIPELAAMAGAVTVRCPRRLVSLFGRSFASVTVESDENGVGESNADFQIAIADVARWLRPSFASFRKRSAYLQADPVRRQNLRRKYEGDRGARFVVGIAWRSTGVQFAAEKSIPLNQWGAILSVPNVTFVNLQYGDCRAEIAAARKGFGVEIVQDPEVDALGDLDAYAAQIAAMDLVITSSNTAAHLGGALGVPTLCLLPSTYGLGRRWYWFAEQESCPWYPSVRTLVQQRPGAWLDVIADAAIAVVEGAARAGVLKNAVGFLAGLAASFEKSKMSGEAERALEAAVRHDPRSIALLDRLAQFKKRLGKREEALALIDRALTVAPHEGPLYNARGVLLMSLDRGDEAIASYAAGLQHAPTSVELHNNLGTALQRAGRIDEAIAQYREGLKTDAKHPALLLNLAAAQVHAGPQEDAEEIFERQFTVTPESADGHYNRAQMLLAAEKLEDGWREFQWRWKRPQSNVTPGHFPAKLWNGEAIAGRNVLAYTELGIGDEVLIAGMLPDLTEAARRVCFLCSARLIRLFTRSFPSVTIGLRAEPLPPCATAPDLDFQMSQSELGLAFRRTPADFPKREKYLVADPGQKSELRAKYQALAPGNLIVGISWASGNPEIGRQKTTDLLGWKSILTTPGVTFVDLQYGDTAGARDIIAREMGVHLYRDDTVDLMGDMDRPAAQIAAMDLVISVSNTAVHFAGALGVPTWVMVPEQRGRMWYWFRGRTHSPWYPSVKFYASSAPHAWDVPIAAIAADLRRLISLG